MTVERIQDILSRYVYNDLCAADPQYVRDVLIDICGCTREEISSLGFDHIFPEGYWEEQEG